MHVDLHLVYNGEFWTETTAEDEGKLWLGCNDESVKSRLEFKSLPNDVGWLCACSLASPH